MAYCKNCINAVESNLPEGGLYCTMFRSLCGDTIGCSSGVDGKRKAKTNADTLRAMTDEEIEKWFWWMHKEMMRYTDSRVFVHDWLRQEAKE